MKLATKPTTLTTAGRTGAVDRTSSSQYATAPWWYAGSSRNTQTHKQIR